VKTRAFGMTLEKIEALDFQAASLVVLYSPSDS
jgi:hypothetical protein